MSLQVARNMRMLVLVILLAAFFPTSVTEETVRSICTETKAPGRSELHLAGRDLEESRSGILEPGRTSNTPNSPFSPFSAVKATTFIDFKAVCAFYNGFDSHHRIWERTFNKAERDASSGDRRQVKITCHNEYTMRSSKMYTWKVPDSDYIRFCPAGTICMAVFFISKGDGVPREEIGCIDQADV